LAVDRAATAAACELDRAFGPLMLTLTGVGMVIGAGIFVITGQAAALYAGPAILFSFVIAAIVCAFAGLCYAEMAAMIPVSGSAYSYARTAFGPGTGWVIAWAIVAEYLFAIGAIGIGWSAYMQGVIGDFGMHLPAWWAKSPLVLGAEGFRRTGALVNLPAVAIVALTTGANLLGTRSSARFNVTLVWIKLSAVGLFILFGLMHANHGNWIPFLPYRGVGPNGDLTYGLHGVFKAAGVIFFAYLGFDALATAAQESRNPQRTLPLAILATLGVTTILYMAVAATMTGLTNYRLLNSEAPLTTALAAAGPSLAWLKTYLGMAVMIGLWASLWPAVFGLSRLLMCLSHDRMLPRALGEIVAGRRIPQTGVLVTGGMGMLVAGFLPISLIGELISTGTLIAFATVCAAVIQLRLTMPSQERPFRVPLWQVIAPLGIATSLFLLVSMGWASIARIVAWQCVGGLVLFAALRARRASATPQ
jgi:APA family basic amino acid/polyamine antiporter